jgi:hypothetical protein
MRDLLYDLVAFAAMWTSVACVIFTAATIAAFLQ